MTQITGGELLLKGLSAEGISTLFGVLDGSHNAFLVALEKYGMRYVTSRHEAAAAHMADAWARVRGEPAVVIGGIGPGAANMISGVATAYAEGVPIIVVTGQRRRNIIGPDKGGAFQVLDLVDWYRPVTKWSAGVRQIERLPELLRQAFRVATNGRPGPVYLEIPEDLMRGTADQTSAAVYPANRYRVARLGVGDPAALQQAAHLLSQAKRPLLHAGSGVLWAGAWQEFVALGDHLAAALTTSLAARGVVPEDHPRYAHVLNQDTLQAMRHEADVVLAVGARLGELDGWGRPPAWPDPADQTLIQIDADPAAIGLNRPVNVAIVGDARAVLAALLEAVRSRTYSKPEHEGFVRYRELTARWEENRRVMLQVSQDGVNPGQMVEAVRGFFPRNAITVMDGGNTSLWTASFNPIYQARCYLYTAKFGHLGTGLPYALGAKMAAPDRLVYLITGDGALGFNLQELETAARHEIPVIVVVAVDQGWGMERSSQALFGIDASQWIETEIYPGARYDLVARGLGCYGELVEQLDDLAPALQRAVDSGQPALIQVMVDKMANMAPPGLVEFGSLVYRAEG